MYSKGEVPIRLLIEPAEDFLAWLAALVPKPRSNLTRYFYRIGGGAQLAIQESSGPWISESVAQQIKETDNTE